MPSHIDRYNHSEKGKATRRRYRESPKGKQAQKSWKQSQASRDYDKFYQQTTKGKAVQAVAKRKNKLKRRQVEGSYTAQEWLALKESYGNICLCCRKHESELSSPLEQDHIIPITKGGTNWITNIQPLCHDCNGMGGKGTKIIDYRRYLS
jgi:5-methylcytosine-specific restriction endonuclease McrA